MKRLSELLFSFGIVILLGCGSAPHDITAKVPLGSALADLDRYLDRGQGSTGEVVAWVPLKGLPKIDSNCRSNEFGVFETYNMGSYDIWRASPKERNRFTGEITFIHHGTTSSDVNAFVYIDGKLKKKDWGFLPG